MIGVNRYSDNVEWAHKFADFISNEENQKLRLEKRNQGPSNIIVAKSDDVAKIPAIQAVIEQSQFGKLQRIGNNYWSACTSFVETIINNPNSIDMQELLDEMVSKITASVAQ